MFLTPDETFPRGAKKEVARTNGHVHLRQEHFPPASRHLRDTDTAAKTTTFDAPDPSTRVCPPSIMIPLSPNRDFSEQ